MLSIIELRNKRPVPKASGPLSLGKTGQVLAVYLLESKGGQPIETALNWWERCCSRLQAFGDKGRAGASCDAEQECLCRNAAEAILILQSAAG